jgi:hypothetical protein
MARSHRLPLNESAAYGGDRPANLAECPAEQNVSIMVAQLVRQTVVGMEFEHVFAGEQHLEAEQVVIAPRTQMLAGAIGIHREGDRSGISRCVRRHLADHPTAVRMPSGPAVARFCALRQPDSFYDSDRMLRGF